MIPTFRSLLFFCLQKPAILRKLEELQSINEDKDAVKKK